MKKIILIAIAVLIVGFGAWYFASMDKKEINPIEFQGIVYSNASADLIRVELPFPEAVTGKDFSVIGEARGTWYFEASFPIELFDKNGALLATAVAQAQDDWMTENFVPFKADFNVPESYIGPATLVLKKDNPSGLPEHDASISFPITIEY
jgi:hypothetical protein